MLSLIFIKIGFALLANSEPSAHSLLQVILNRLAASHDPLLGVLIHSCEVDDYFTTYV